MGATIKEERTIAGKESINNKQYSTKSKISPKALFSVDKEQMLFDEVKYGNEDKVFELLEEIFNEMLNSKLDEKLIKTRCLEITIMLSRAAIEGGVSLETTLHFNQQLIKEMNSTIELEEKFNLTKQFVKGYIVLIHKKNKIENLEIIKRVKKFILSNYSKKLTLNQIADHVYLSISYLSKLFKETMGVTIMDYVTQIRLREAKRLLRKTEMSLKDIAELTGYYDASYLSKMFKKQVSITPGQYRLNTQKRV